MFITLMRKSLINLFSCIPFSYLRQLTGSNLILPFYHVVSDRQLPHIKYLYKYKNIIQFKDDVEFLLKYYRPISLSDILERQKTNRTLPKHSFLLTFDDGLREVYDVISPILKQKGIPATFFLTSNFLDNKELFYRHKASILIDFIERASRPSYYDKIKETFLKNRIKYTGVKSSILSINYDKKIFIDELASGLGVDFNDYLNKKKPYLDSDQVEKLITDGFTIGAHSIDHPRYQYISLEEQLWQTKESMKMIKKRFSLDYCAFATPHSDKGISKKYFDEIFKSKCVDFSFGTSAFTIDLYNNSIQRQWMEDTYKTAEKIFFKYFAIMAIRSMLGKEQTTFMVRDE